MTKRIYKYFFDFVVEQENWLNKMSAKGYRLIECGKTSYLFEESKPREYTYSVEYVADMGYKKAENYRGYLEDIGYKVFYKNININYSWGKMKWRPYSKKSGQIAVFQKGYNKELLILESKTEKNLPPLHTDAEDLMAAYKSVRCAYLWKVLVFGVLSAALINIIIKDKLVIGAFSASIYGFAAAVSVATTFLFAFMSAKLTKRIQDIKNEKDI